VGPERWDVEVDEGGRQGVRAGGGLRCEVVCKVSSIKEDPCGALFNWGSSLTAVPMPTMIPSCMVRIQWVMTILSAPLRISCLPCSPAILASSDWAKVSVRCGLSAGGLSRRWARAEARKAGGGMGVMRHGACRR
jgi:hypothetical protein